jgi:hypothetical protein
LSLCRVGKPALREHFEEFAGGVVNSPLVLCGVV